MKLILPMLLAAFAAFAGVSGGFTQYGPGDFSSAQRDEQPWLGAQYISLHVAAGSRVWLSNYVSSWYAPVADLGTVYDMTRYGYVRAADIPSGAESPADYADKVHWAAGTTAAVVYGNDSGPRTASTTGYLLDYFGEDDEIYFVMSTLPAQGAAVVDSYQFVADATHDTPLTSRVFRTNDQAGNVRVDFGVNGVTGLEFVALFDSPVPPAPTGQPLPGALAAGAMVLGSAAAVRRIRRR